MSTSNVRRAASSRPALRRCIAIEPDAFAEVLEPWSLLTTFDELGEDFSDLLTLDTVDELLSRRGLRTPFLRVAKDGKVVDASRFTRSGAPAPRSPTSWPTTSCSDCSSTAPRLCCRDCTACGHR